MSKKSKNKTAPASEVTSMEAQLPIEGEQPMVLIIDTEINIHESLFDGLDVSSEPHFTVSEAAKFFFRRSSHWIRLQENSGLITRVQTCRFCGGDGQAFRVDLKHRKHRWIICPICQGETTTLQRVAVHRTEGGARYYDLADIEQMAQAFYEHKVINEDQLRHALAIARLEGRLWEYL